jgi:hypothetical protein
MSTLSSDRSAQPRDSRALWLGVVGPPLLWLTQFEVRYALAGVPPGSGRHFAVIGTGILAAALIVLLGLLSLRQWRVAESSPLDQSAGVTGRIRFMALLGVMTSGLFFLATAAQILAHFFIPPGNE